MLEAAAEEMQAALLASIDEEASNEKQGKPKRKAGKKGKRSKKGADIQPAEGEEGAEQAAGEELTAGTTGGPGEQHSEDESEATAVATESAVKEAADVHSRPVMEQPSTSDRHAAASSQNTEDEEWKVRGWGGTEFATFLVLASLDYSLLAMMRWHDPQVPVLAGGQQAVEESPS